MAYIKVINDTNNIRFACVKPCIVDTPLVVKANKLKDVYNGHGEGETK
jgi:hypothetical protein